jgi:hypothetical protein
MKIFTKIIQAPGMTTIVGIVPGGGMGTVEGINHHKSIDSKAKTKDPENTCRS